MIHQLHGVTLPSDPFSFTRVNGLQVEFNPIRRNRKPMPVLAGTPRHIKRIGHWEGGWAAQLFVGLNVGNQERWTAEQVRDLTMKLRREQLALEMQEGIIQASELTHGGSIVPQFGYWEMVLKDGKTGFSARERSVAVTVLNLPGEPEDWFKRNMEELAAQLAVSLLQDSVVVQLSYAGNVRDVFEYDTKNEED